MRFLQRGSAWPIFAISNFMIFCSVAALSQDYTSLRPRLEPSLVFIETEIQNNDGTNRTIKTGTGYIVSPDGFVITAAHVVPLPSAGQQVAYSASLRTRHGHRYRLEVVTRHHDIDAALVRLPNTGQQLAPARFRLLSPAKADTSLYTLGFPGSSDLASASGMISSTTGAKGYWQTTLPLNVGNSGGPVFDSEGYVVGMAVGGVDSAQQRTYVVPINYLISILGIVRVDVVAPNNPVAGTLPTAVSHLPVDDNRFVVFVRDHYLPGKAEYTDPVDFFSMGTISRSDAIQESRKYESKWPQRQYSLLPNTTRVTKVGPDYVVTSRYSYLVSNAKSQRRGSGAVELVLIPDGMSFRVRRVKEIVFRDM